MDIEPKRTWAPSCFTTVCSKALYVPKKKEQTAQQTIKQYTTISKKYMKAPMEAQRKSLFLALFLAEQEPQLYGATILSNYFGFKAPSDAQKKDDGIVADSHFFPLNSHAALQFYAKDNTINKKYNALYQLGWPEKTLLKVGSEQKTITGGQDQKNDSHILELFAAFAAHHFFESEQRAEGKTKYLHKEVQDIGNFTFQDLSGSNSNDFKKKLTALFAVGVLLLVTQKGLESDDNGIKSLIKRLKDSNVLKPDFFVEDEQLKQIHKYFKLFLFDVPLSKANTLLPGWLYQIKNSVGDSKFLFKDEVFIRERASMSSMDIGSLLSQLKPSGLGGLLNILNNTFNIFFTELKNAKPDDGPSKPGTLLKMLYNTTIKLQNP